MASKCIDCGACEKRCPQGIPIRTELKAVARSMENFAARLMIPLLRRRFGGEEA